MVAATVARTFGVRGLALRAWHELRRQAGLFRRLPRHASARPRLASAFVVDEVCLGAATDRAAAIDRAERVAVGAHEAFRWDWRPLPGSGAEWTRNPFTGHEYEPAVPWFRIQHLEPAAGDIKDVWEPARFLWAYDLVRGFLLTRDERYPEAFFGRLRDFAAACEPFRGVQWSCGQEVAIRAIALLFAEANFSNTVSLQSNAHLLPSLLAASGERIADAIGYAVSQRNNHAISEAAALIALGSRFLGEHPEAGRWSRLGRRVLERAIAEQFAEDGWYAQHSFTYMRLALEQCVVAERALRATGGGLSARARARIRAAGNLLMALADSTNGYLPNHGANDGAFVLPVSLAEYRDFRPAITAVAATFDVPVPLDLDLDPEVLAWLGLAAPQTAPARTDNVLAGSSGWASARVGGTTAFIRAGRYRSRPSHLDPLHLDVSRPGREVVVDPGTFSYNGVPPWRNGLVTAKVHNGPLLDDTEPGVRGPRFLWYLWPAAKLRSASLVDGAGCLEAEVPERVRRSVQVRTDEVVVTDEVLASSGANEMMVRWLLHPAVDAGLVSCDPPGHLRIAEEGDPTGWFSPMYGSRVHSRVIEVVIPARRGARVTTRFKLGTVAPVGQPTDSRVRAPGIAGGDQRG